MKKIVLIGLTAFIFGNTTIIAQTTGTLDIAFTTSPTGNPLSEAPKNVYAVWIEDASGLFVATVHNECNERCNALESWLGASGLAAIDAVSGATQTSHGARTSVWNGKNQVGNLMPDGAYKVCMEVADDDPVNFTQLSKHSCFDFSKTSTDQTTTPTDVTSLSNITLVWTATGSVNVGITTTTNEKSFKVILIPGYNTLQVQVPFNVGSIALVDMNGKTVYASTQGINSSNIDVAAFAKGIYLVKAIDAKTNQTFVEKIVLK